MGERERGSASVIVLGLTGVVLLLLVSVLGLRSAVQASHRARSAADLAALAAAQAWNDPSRAGDPCAAAIDIAGRNGATVTSCSIQGDTVLVEAVVHPNLPGLGGARAVARAGPAMS